jgi:glycosyltransferase involved in cell wall biosynthesis
MTASPPEPRPLRLYHVGAKGIPSRGGTERVVEAIARRQAAAGHEVTVYGSRLVCRSGWVEGVRVVALPTARHKYLGPVLLQLACAAHVLARGRRGVIHLHGAENAFVLPLLRLRYPVVTTNHGPAYRREKWGSGARALIRAVDGLSVRLATRATAVSAVQADELTRRYGRPVAAIPNGVAEGERVDEDAARRLLHDHGLESRAYVLFAAARVDPTKGCLTLIRALGRLDDPPPLLVVGDLHHAPGHEEELRDAAAGLPVTFVPRLDDKAVLLGLLREARLFVFPSTVEAMSMMLLEALDQGAPVLASDIPENTSVLPGDVPTFRAGDEADLARAVSALLAAPADVQDAARQAARAWVHERFRWDAIAAAYEREYRAAVARTTQV